MPATDIRHPRVKDLVAFLAKQNQEAYVLISDGHEGTCQLHAYAGVIEVHPKYGPEGGYVRDFTSPFEVPPKPGATYAPAVQIDSGC